MKDSIGTNVEEMDLHGGEGEKTKGKGKKKRKKKKLWISYSQLTYIAQVVKYQCQCNNKECLKNLLMQRADY
jgi:hypothetical protein